ncbi:DUF2971 domain-containing protein [Pseudovibrio ascidiaceicola]|uniref:DUF2971 domain-containing protein n=1 Tax=Pseudovibrio ascidiaceicola TaxID=285279 RepID=UPI003D35EEF4
MKQNEVFHRLYYFTEEQHAYKNILNREIKISTFDALNDSHEFKNIDTSGKSQRPLRRSIDNLIKKTGEVKGLICLSKCWRSPLMWGYYANRGQGVCLGFDVPNFPGADAIVTPIKYTKTKISLDELDLKNNPYEVMDNLLHTKFIDWKHEKEMRMIVAKSTCEEREGLWFSKFDNTLILKEVYLGDKCPKSVSDYEKLISETNYTSTVQVKQTRPAFGRYEYTVSESVPQGELLATNT